MFKRSHSYREADRGASSIEYAVVVILLAIALSASMPLVSEKMAISFEDIQFYAGTNTGSK